MFALLLFFPAILHARVIKWEGKPISVSISTERLTRIEFPETLRSVFLSRSDIAVEREDRSLYVRALAPEVEDTLFVVGESGTTYEINLSISDNPDQTVVISLSPKSLQAQAEQARTSACSGSHALDDARTAGGWVRNYQGKSKRSLSRRFFLHEAHRCVPFSRAAWLRHRSRKPCRDSRCC